MINLLEEIDLLKKTLNGEVVLLPPYFLEEREVNEKIQASVDCQSPCFDKSVSLSEPDWMILGEKLHHPENLDESGRSIQVRVGLDFGSAFTKVVIRVGQYFVPVKWSDAFRGRKGGGEYVLPGIVCCNSLGNYKWTNEEGYDKKGDLKIPLLSSEAHMESKVASVAFLALVLRYARAYLYRDKELSALLSVRKLRWSLSIGCPTKPHENPEVVAVLKSIAKLAWHFSMQKIINDKTVQEFWPIVDSLDLGLEEDPLVVPEFVAQISGYLKSNQKRNGLHAMVDIGAGTLDVATFNIFKNKNDDESEFKATLFYSSVEQNGVHFLQKNRCDSLNMKLSWDNTQKLESSRVFAKRVGAYVEEVEDVDAKFVEKVAKQIGEALNFTKSNKRGDPTSKAWSTSLPVFITGGGANSYIYNQAIEKAEEYIRRNSTNKKFAFTKLPVSVDFKELTIDKGRMTVAYGLTESTEDLISYCEHSQVLPLILGVAREKKEHVELYGD